MVTVLFACVHNAGRSQIAAALFNQHASPDKARAISAGSHPASRVHPEVVTAMKLRGIDLSAQTPQLLTPDLASTAGWLITMGCGDQCPVVPGTRRADWPIPDPKGQSPRDVDGIVETIDNLVRALVVDLCVA